MLLVVTYYTIAVRLSRTGTHKITTVLKQINGPDLETESKIYSESYLKKYSSYFLAVWHAFCRKP
jgi:hypothetical protein